MFEKTALALDSECSASLELETCLELAQEAAHLSCTYDEVLISVADCIPYTWVCLMQVSGVTMLSQLHYIYQTNPSADVI